MVQAVGLVILLLFVLIPLGMGEMSDCPMCTAPDSHVTMICAAVFSLLVGVFLGNSTLIRSPHNRAPGLLLARSLYRPPRPS